MSAKRQTSLWNSILRPWILEVAMWLSASAILVAICLIMDHANGKAVRDWDLPINLNSLIATLSTVYRALLVAIAAEIISQEKWIYGSRSIFGAVKLLPIVLRQSIPSALAILIIIASFAVGPFAQQSLNTINRDTEIPSDTASIPVSRSAKGIETWYRGGGNLYGVWDLTFDARGTLYTTVTSPTSNDSTIDASCSSGNCTFPSWEPAKGADSKQHITHASVGVCSTCNDVSSLIKQGETWEGLPALRLPKEGMELRLNTDNQYMRVDGGGNLSWAEPVISREKVQSLRWSFTNITVFMMTRDDMPANDEEIRPIAVTCSLYPCLRSYSAYVRNGKLTESLVHSTPMYPDLGEYTGKDLNKKAGISSVPVESYFLAAIQSPCRVEVTASPASRAQEVNTTTVRLFDPAKAPDYPAEEVSDQCVYRFDNFFAGMMGSFFSKELLNGTCLWNPRQGAELDCDKEWWLARLRSQGFNTTVGTITNTFSDIADALTSKFRVGFGRDNGTTESVAGVALQTLSYTSIEWQWLSLPASLLIIETLILIWMIARSWMHRNEERVWKSNVLPLLYYGDRFTGMDGPRFQRTDDVMNRGATSGSLMTTDEMEKDAKHVKVRFVRGLRQDDDS
ncbi:hypothetical protein NM208_g1066 [Fusarium decemcellulare]|uniref:Uncharacterized protein n=1 Tax=Fusarium decemcellulare TaxID=57161 RepID=A0ACC1SXZ2_9HYPO|nr:hypothetical protein NM208_g1066 [Fusarium decemcellulare]